MFLACEPLAGWRHVAVTERRTMQDFAHQMRWLVDEAYPEAQVVRLVLDNLNTRPGLSIMKWPTTTSRQGLLGSLRGARRSWHSTSPTTGMSRW